MMLEALLGAALRTLLLALLVELGLRLLRVRHAQLLLAAWTAVLVASLAMPMLQRYALIAIPVPVNLPVSFTSLPMAALPTAAIPTTAGPATDAIGVTTPAVVATVHHDAAVHQSAWRFWLTTIYLVVAAALLLRLLIGLLLSWHLIRGARPLADNWATDSRVRLSAAVASPVTVGRSILLPADCGSWTAATQQAVLAHERAHVASGDFYVLALSQLNRALFWFNPLSWWLHRRLASLAELNSDDAAMEALGDGPGYAAVLLEMARRSAPMLGGVAMARPATMRVRIERVLAQAERPLPPGWRKRATYAAGVAPLALATAISISTAAPANKTAFDRQREPHKAIAIDPKLLDAYVGFYRNTETGSIMIVTRDGDHLLTHRAGFRPVPEYPYTDHDFFLTVAAIQNSFITDASGAVVRVVHHEMGQTETLERLSNEDGERAVAEFMQRLDAERAPHAEIAIDPQLLDGYVGAYQLNPRLVFTVTRDGNKLYARLTGQQTFEVHPYSDRDFFYTVVAAQLTFVVGADGKATAVILHQNGRDRAAERVDLGLAQAIDRKMDEQREPRTVVSIDPSSIDRYVGRYLNDKIEITASREGNQLYVQTTGYPRHAVYPYADRDFFATDIPAQFSFVTDQTGKASQLVRHQFGKDVVLNRIE
jgi:beta-lactamase regulating signal transducer with metallopeptidase domain